jgi:hypothetical protein
MSDATDRIVAIKAVSDLIQPDVAPTLTTGEVELEVDRAKLASTWAVNTVYSASKVIVVGNGHAYQVVQSGTSQATALSVNDWPAYNGAMFGDGNSSPQLQWREIGTAAFNPRISGAEFNVYDIERAAKALARIKMVRCAQFIQDGDVSFQQMYDHWKEQWEYFRPFRRQIELVRC